ncbi:MAG: response regulator [Flavobacteriaceae bacterium]
MYKTLSIFMALFLIISCFNSINAQRSTKENDSLIPYYRKLDIIGKKAESFHFLTGTKDSIDQYFEKGRTIRKSIPKNDSIDLRFFHSFTKAYRYYPKEFNMYLDSVKRLADKRKSGYYLYSYYIFKATNEKNNGNYNKALKYNLTALKDSTLLKNKYYSAILYFNVAGLYKKLQRHSLSKQMSDLAVNSFDTTTNFGKKYAYKFYLYKLRGLEYSTINEAEEFFKQAIPVFENSKKKSLITYTHVKLGNMYLRRKMYKNALDLFTKAYDMNPKNTKNYVDFRFAQYYVLEKNFTKAKEHFERFSGFYDDFRDVSSYNDDFTDINLLGKTIYSNTGDFEKALYFSEKHVENVLKILKQKEEGLVEEFGAMFETEEKEKTIIQQELQLEREESKFYLLTFGTTTLLLTFVFLFFWFKRDKERKVIVLKHELEIQNQKALIFEDVFHEIRTPLTIIGGYLDLVNKSLLKPALIKKYSNLALKNCQRIINDANNFLLLVTSPEKNTALTENLVEKQKLISFINKFLSYHGENMKLKNINLRFNTNIHENLILELDYEKLETILNNLIMNAIKYSPDNTDISFSALIREGKLYFSILDQGPGIPSEELDFVFERYYRASNMNVTSGIGIGLSIVKNYVDLLKGNIQVRSESNLGCEFSFSIPFPKVNIAEFVSENPKSSPIILSEDVPTEDNTNSKLSNILIVEDNFEMTQYLKELLSPIFNIDISLSVESAINKLKQKEFELIISDLRMPKLDGLMFKEILNDNEEFKDIPFMLITASTLTIYKDQGLTLGINDYLVKPFCNTELITRIKVLLSNKEAQLKAIINFVANNKESLDEKTQDDLIFEINKLVLKHLKDEDFTVEKLAEKMNYSQRQLTRIIKKQTGLSPIKLILEIRLLKAYDLIVTKKSVRVNDVMYEVGIYSSSYFSKCFYERFGIKPRDLIKK